MVPPETSVLQNDPKGPPSFPVLSTSTAVTPWKGEARGSGHRTLQQEILICEGILLMQLQYFLFQKPKNTLMYVLELPPLAHGRLHSSKPRAYLSPKILHLSTTLHWKWRQSRRPPHSPLLPAHAGLRAGTEHWPSPAPPVHAGRLLLAFTLGPGQYNAHNEPHKFNVN